jgi:hypothetical protein
VVHRLHCICFKADRFASYVHLNNLSMKGWFGEKR